MVNDSLLNERMAAAQAGKQLQFEIYGDGAYALRSHIRRGHMGNNLTAEQRAENAVMSEARVSVEHAFGKVRVQIDLALGLPECVSSTASAMYHV